MVELAPRHERVEVRMWTPTYDRWWAVPYRSLKVSSKTDFAVDQATIEMEASTELAPLLRMARNVRVPVHIRVNGVVWTGTIASTSRRHDDQDDLWVLRVESDHKHGHRLLARDPVVSASDGSETHLQTTIGELTGRLWSRGAERTGLPVYLLVEGESDPVVVEVRTEDTIADILQERIIATTSHVEVRMLMPGDELPGSGQVRRYAGQMERAWENQKLSEGWWPDASTHPRLADSAVDDKILLPSFSWRGTGSVGILGTPVSGTGGFCWYPFESSVDRGSGYYEDRPTDGVRVATRTALEDIQVSRVGTGFPHVTHWVRGAFAAGRDLGRLDDTIQRDLLEKPDGTPITSRSAAMSYIGSGEAHAWRDGITWVLADEDDFEAEKTRRQPNDQQRMTPGLLVHVFPERDRRQVVFSTTDGGGLSGYESTHTAPDGAQLVAATQLDEQLINALDTTPVGVSDELGALPGGKALPVGVETVAVDSQPLATMEGTDVSLHNAGGRTNIETAGPMFLREKYVSISSGGDSPVLDLMRAWSEAQGSTSVSLEPDYNSGAVFGDSVVSPGGTILHGWRPGDRVSFVDGEARLSEVVAGYELEVAHDRPLRVTPVLGRRDAGVMAELADRLRTSEKHSERSLVAPPRRLPKVELDQNIDENDTVVGAWGRADDAWGYADRSWDLAGTAKTRADQAWNKADSVADDLSPVEKLVNAQIEVGGALRNTVNLMDSRVNGRRRPATNSNLWYLNNNAWKLQSTFNTMQTTFNKWAKDSIEVLDARIPYSMTISSGSWVLNGSWGLFRIVGNNFRFEKSFNHPTSGRRYSNSYPCRLVFSVAVEALDSWAVFDSATLGTGTNAYENYTGHFQNITSANVTIYRTDSMPTLTLPYNNSNFTQELGTYN